MSFSDRARRPSWALLLALVSAACAPLSRNVVKAKVFALNPDEYVGMRVGLTGKVAEFTPGGAYFVVEDETGKVLVTTERLASRLNCPRGASISLEGSLNRVSIRDGSPSAESASEGTLEGLYFSMDSLMECNEPR